MPLNEDTRLAAKEIVGRYPRARSALLPMLHLVQAEEGYVSPEGVRFCADVLGLSKAEVGAVATFYTMYKRRPTGEYLVSVCTNTLCDVLGGEAIYQSLSESLGVGHDETTADGTITLEHAECLAACDYAPVVTVNYEFFDQQDVESASSLVGELRAGRRPLPTRGAPLCSFREISRQLAGFPDERPGALDAGPAGGPTLVGNRLAVARGETAPPYDAPTPLDKPAPAPAQAGAPAGGAPPKEAAAPAAPAPAGTAPAGGAAGTAPAAAAPAAKGTGQAATAGVSGQTAGGGAPAPAGGGERTGVAETGERTTGPVAEPDNAAERSAAEGTARYGGTPGEPSSGGAEGGAAGLDTAQSDPASDAAVDKEPGAATAEESSSTGTAPRAPTNRARKSPRKER